MKMISTLLTVKFQGNKFRDQQSVGDRRMTSLPSTDLLQSWKAPILNSLDISNYLSSVRDLICGIF